MSPTAPAKTTSQRDVLIARLREAYRHSRAAARAIARARKETAGDLKEAFSMDAADRTQKAMAAIEEAARLLQKS
jgi:hypothetical protein